ncbi:kxDL motif-containing protein 1-like [Diadema antillarum]|uniref:kxDL motif-containing protein 1-like n=1 Tax=Diadema antillarum TaxID=105358 RepID=UPI003A875106
MSSTTTTTPGSDAFVDSLLSMVNHEDLLAILSAQSQMLVRFEKTNEMLSNFNRLSAKRYEKTVEQFKEHTDTLLKMKKDLDSVFRRIRGLKRKLATDYPQAFVAALEDIVPPDLDEEEEDVDFKGHHQRLPTHQWKENPPQGPSVGSLPPHHSHSLGTHSGVKATEPVTKESADSQNASSQSDATNR